MAALKARAVATNARARRRDDAKRQLNGRSDSTGLHWHWAPRAVMRETKKAGPNPLAAPLSPPLSLSLPTQR